MSFSMFRPARWSTRRSTVKSYWRTNCWKSNYGKLSMSRSKLCGQTSHSLTECGTAPLWVRNSHISGYGAALSPLDYLCRVSPE